MKTTRMMRTVSTSDIGMAFIALRESLDVLRKMMEASTLPVWVFPTTADPLQSAVNHICRLWMLDDLGSPKVNFLSQTHAIQLDTVEVNQIESGIFCADEATFKQVDVVNVAKTNFRVLCETFSKEELAVSGTTNRVKTTVSEELKRNSALRAAFRSMGISQLNLRWCYNQIHTLDQPIYRIGFTWQRNHADRKRMTRDEAVDYCHRTKQSVSDETLARWENELMGFPTEAFFVRSKSKTPQQRANYRVDRDGPFKTIVTPAVVVIRSNTLPDKYQAKSLTDMNDPNGERIDSLLDVESALGFRGLHRLPERLWAEEARKRGMKS